MSKRDLLLNELVRMQKEINDIRISHTNPEEIELLIADKEKEIERIKQEISNLDKK